MPWVAEDDFESYTPGFTINGQTPGGSGWSVGWHLNGIGDWTVEVDPTDAGNQVVKCQSNTNNTHAYRELTTPATSGFVQWRMRTDNVAPNDQLGVVLEKGTNGIYGRCYVSFGASNVQAYNATGAVWVNLVAASINTWYTIVVEFDCGTELYRVSVNGGSFSAWLTMNNTPTTSIDAVRLDSSHVGVSPGAIIWIDDIQPYVSPEAIAYFRTQFLT